jgi:hypothetical protein
MSVSVPTSQSTEQRTFFEVSVHADNIKAFSAALHLLQKVGKDLTIEVEASTFTLRYRGTGVQGYTGTGVQGMGHLRMHHLLNPPSIY